jgi:hypothetical protein
MKKFMILLPAALIINLLMLPDISGQEIKTEKKIKIIIADDSGEKVVIDTLLSGDSDIETIKLDDGKMIYITGEGKNHEKAGSKHVTVMVKSDDETGEKIKDNQEESTVTVFSSSDNAEGNKVIVVKKKSEEDLHTEKNIDVFVTSDDDESSIDKSRFVVAKDGMVVTVEGEDEEKAKELMKVIEEHLGINKKEEGKQAKTDSKKSQKK